MIYDSRREETGYDAIIDYRMSEKFGLDWRKYSSIRMFEFIKIIGFENERQEKEAKKQEKKYGRQQTTGRH